MDRSATQDTSSQGAQALSTDQSTNHRATPTARPASCPENEASWEHLLRILGRGGTAQYYFTLPGATTIWFPADRPEAIPVGAVNVYFGVHPTGKAKAANERAGNLDICAINCLYADFDAKDYDDDKQCALQHLLSLTVSPSVIIDSGGGYHCYWLLDGAFMIESDEDRARAQRIQDGWVHVVGGDKGAKDLARVLRVPGTKNYKSAYAPAFPTVSIIKSDLALTYGLAELEMPALDALAEAKMQEPGASRCEVLGSGGRPGDHFNKRGDISELLTRAGWTPTRTRGAVQYWMRPGKDARDAISASFNYIPNRFYVFSSAPEIRPFQVDRAYDPFAVYALLQHDGDFSAAARELAAQGYGDNRPDHVVSTEDGATPQVVSEQTAGSYRLDDIGNAERFVSQHARKIRYVKGWGWMCWDGRRWVRDNGQVMMCAKDTARSIYTEAARCANDAQREAIAKHAGRSASKQRLGSMIELAESDPLVRAEIADFDADPLLFNCMNGTIDLRTGELGPHNPDDLISHLSPVCYDPHADSPMLKKFLMDVTRRNEELESFLQRVAGYALTGLNTEKALFLVQGPHDTGKTTFIEADMSMMGDYAHKATAETFMVRKYPGGARNDVAALAGARLVTATEMARSQKLDAVLIKEATGGDRMTARFLYQEQFTYTPQFKIWLATNDPPEMDDTDDALWERVKRVSFDNVVPAERRDPGLKKALCDPNHGGVALLAWAVQGCLAWQRDGLKVPASVVTATQAIREEMDPYTTFFEDMCVFEPNGVVRTADLLNAYESWAIENGLRSTAKATNMGARLKARGCQPVNHWFEGRRARGWRGIALRGGRRHCRVPGTHSWNAERPGTTEGQNP